MSTPNTTNSDKSFTGLVYVITNVFPPFPPEAQPHEDRIIEDESSLVRAVCTAARAYTKSAVDTLEPQWRCVAKMLDSLLAFVQHRDIESQLCTMRTGDTLVFFNRDPDAAAMFTRQDHCTLYESFQSSWNPRSTLTSSYPRWTLEIPNEMLHKQEFHSELPNLLLYENGITNSSEDSINAKLPMLADILRGSCHTVPRIHKRVYSHARIGSWQRSSLWLLVKVAIRMSLDRGGVRRVCYKVFMLYFMCHLAMNAIHERIPSRLLHAISAKILRRLRKLQASAPDWLNSMVVKTNTLLRGVLEARWKEAEVAQPPPSSWNPSQLNLHRDMQLSLLEGRKYIHKSLANLALKPIDSHFCPQHLPRGILDDLLCSNKSFFEEAYRVDHHTALYDVEQAVEQGIDDWVACVADVDQACIQLEILMDKYLAKARYVYQDSPEHISRLLLTVIELWVALDKLVVATTPILVNYSPEIPIELLQMPLFSKTMNLHRLRRAYQYLSARHSQCYLGNSMFSEESTINMFPVRRNVNPPHLRCHIERSGPTIPLDVNIVVFELQCPVSLHVWRSATVRLLGASPSFSHPESHKWDDENLVPVLFVDIARLQPFLIKHSTSPDTGRVHLTCLVPISLQSWDTSYHTLWKGYPIASDQHFVYWHPSSRMLHRYTNETSHTSNGILVVQAKHTNGLSSSEFIAFGHLRSGGSLQWLNILRELRSRTLNFRRQDVYLLLTHATTQVGPFDLNMTEWTWHQELQELSFCCALLGELESLLMDVGVRSLDGVMMGTISFLLARLLASCCDEDILDQAIRLLRQVRTKTFEWVQEFSYGLMVAPTNTERSKLLTDMATTCRSTFDVDPTILHKLLFSAEDVEALVSCAIFIHANTSQAVDSRRIPEYSRLLIERDRHLSFIVEDTLRNVILADASNRGIDLAIRNVWSGYRPGPRQWQPLAHPNTHWLMCETAARGKKRAQIVHLNLLDGSLLVDGKQLNGLPPEIRKQPTYERIFGNQDFLVTASDLPGMDLTTIALISDHRVHFTLQDGDLVIRAQHKDMGDILEVIPQERLQADLPAAFIHSHVHWLNLSTHVIELRPRERIWEHSSDNWRIDCATGQYRMYKGHECLVDVRSSTWEMVSGRLKCLDIPENLIITTSLVNSSQLSGIRQLSITLPRYKLSFFINEAGDLESRDFKGMIYDENQYIGTLFGLESRLVLRPNVWIEEELIHRRVIIPDGLFSCKQNSGHRSFFGQASNIKTHRQPITYQTYKVDTDLGCLTGHTTWTSKLYLAQLHIQTSIDWMPDPLTGRTGIQEALQLLQSAGCRSIIELDIRYGKLEGPRLLSSPSYKIYPQISFAIEEINYLVDRERFLHADQNALNESTSSTRPQPDVTATLRSAYLFPSSNIDSSSPATGRDVLGQLFLDRSAPELPAPNQLQCCGPKVDGPLLNPDTRALQQLFTSVRIKKTDHSFQEQYMSRLHDSARHVREPSNMTCRRVIQPSIEEFRKHFVQCRENYMAGLTIVKKALGPTDDIGHAHAQAGQWPQITPNTLFRCLASNSRTKLPEDWKQCLVSLAVLLLELQRSRRLLRFFLENLEEELLRELENEVCDGWNAKENPDWLLIQLQEDFLLRGIQADVAVRMISPTFGENTTMQVNMGEGKSSVILPMSAATLADGNKLVRVIVPKSLAVRMFRTLVDRLGGLVNRPVYHLPFSRALTGNYDRQQFKMLCELLFECVRHRGILVVQPEHVLSLKLTSVAKQIQIPRSLHSDYTDSNQVPNNALLKLQKWVQSCSRDILDEVDEILHPRFQLTYTIGYHQPIEGYPDRWTITQQILRLVRMHALSLAHDLPHTIEYELDASGSFPRIRILHASDARQRLISLVVDDVMNGRLKNFNFRDIDRDRRLHAAVRAFISSKNVSKRTAEIVEKYAQPTILWGGILLLRGLLACDILLFAVTERRWRVDYGLLPMRTMLAVPYRAKDAPAPRAEFGHPDVTIILTCLSYYYGGLTEEQLRTSFEILQEQADPSTEYANWLGDYDPDSVPACVQDLSNVNIKSSEQWDRYLFPLFARNQGAVDFYLSRIVFPKEAKEFPHKLAASGWDLVEKRKYPVTGFSGTNLVLLPTSITQRDPDHQRGTTARVLSHLLRSENSTYALISHANGDRKTTLELLRMVANQQPQIRVFLDVGAQILDFSNYQVAKAWLGLSSDSDGAIYFNEDDELMVLTKDDNYRPLISSPLAQRLDRCVVYLDDAHTRGTDLKFPNKFRAAVTLGPKVTNDRLIQGCMRMRKLGHGHSVMFFAPLEVDGSIRAVSAKDDPDKPVTTTDILHWTIHETWTDIQERSPYWAKQGIDHHSRYNAWIQFSSNKITGEELADEWLQPGIKSLSSLYAPFPPQKKRQSRSSMLHRYPYIQQRCIDFGIIKLPEAQMDEEQEREVNREIAQEQETQLLPRAEPSVHCVHPEVVSFVRTGVIPPLHASSPFHPVFTTLKKSSAATSEAHIGSPFVLATTDFSKTIEPHSHEGKVDPYLRPVQWVLSGKKDSDRVLVILSPFEANYLMQDIRVSKYVHLHVYTPRTSQHIKSSEDLMFYSIPPVSNSWVPPWDLVDQLNLFAGQLYLRDYESYLRLRHFLGIDAKNLPKSVGPAIQDNLISADVLEEVQSIFKDSPLPSVITLLSIRRRGLAFAETHMGRILQGELLTKNDFEGLERSKVVHARMPPYPASATVTIGEGDPSSAMLSLPSKRRGGKVHPCDEASGRSGKRPRTSRQ